MFWVFFTRKSDKMYIRAAGRDNITNGRMQVCVKNHTDKPKEYSALPSVSNIGVSTMQQVLQLIAYKWGTICDKL